jgi:hypothetical protein
MPSLELRLAVTKRQIALLTACIDDVDRIAPTVPPRICQAMRESYTSLKDELQEEAAGYRRLLEQPPVTY